MYLVGAGPGHPELLTLKAAELLRQADVIVYDRLIQEEVLALGKPAAERLYMGKPVGKHDSRQQEIHELLVRKAREGKLVVRLKGGDPFLFGRGGEEAEYLLEHGVPFDVIPGVPSALAAPLSAGISVTHRDASSSVAIVTGHESDKEKSLLDWGALARMETLVVLMGVGNTARIAQRLMEHGRDPDTPAAMIQMAYWPRERVVTGTLATIAREVERAAVKPPATLVIGKVVAFRERLVRAERDLKRRADGSAGFEAGPQPDQLLRLAAAGLGSQVLHYALSAGLFDALEQPLSAADLAERFGLNEAALEDILNSLVALGLVELSEQGYRNLELASRYLTTASPRSLKPVLLQLAAQPTQEPLSRYARQGTACGHEPGQSYFEACETLARLAVPAVVDRLEARLAGGAQAPVLVIGWAALAYQEELARRWPDLAVTAWNPFLPGSGDLQPLGEPSQDAVLLSCPLASCRRGHLEPLLREAAGALHPGGLLALFDAFLPEGTPPAPEVVLGGLGRRIRHDACGVWSVRRLRDALAPLGVGQVRFEPVTAGMLLVTAEKIRP